MIKIEIWSDINCPFCYIGKRHLEAALEDNLGQKKFQIDWKSFELDPKANPLKGIDNTDLLAKKYGRDRKWALEMNENMTLIAAKAGLEFQMEKVIPANSFTAHRLIHLAKKFQKQDQMIEKLLSLKFTEGQDIGDPEVLMSKALEIGLGEENIRQVLEGAEFGREVREDEAQAAKLGISGVPYFVFNQKFALSGAQPIEAFKEVLRKLDQ